MFNFLDSYQNQGEANFKTKPPAKQGHSQSDTCIPRPRRARRFPRGRQKHNFSCIPRTPHARSPQRVSRADPETQFRPHSAHSTRTISALGLLLRAAGNAINFTYIPRTQHARSPQRVARADTETQFRLHSARSTRTISAEGHPGKTRKSNFYLHSAPSTRTITARNAISPAFLALDTHDLRRGWHLD